MRRARSPCSFGSLLILVAAVGVLRFPDALSRMHALSKASTLGVSIALLGAAIARTDISDTTSLLFATVLQAATSPVASTLLMQATYYAEGIVSRVDTADELAETFGDVLASPLDEKSSL